jgi:peptidoglycan/xylan/chitin deacetylase (PgdA/CDA1 family)
MPLTIVMYHYVRDLERSRYPRIKALSVEQFRAQLDYITRHFRVYAARDLARALKGRAAPPVNGCLLTFDDGLIDHYRTVLPMLRERGLTASFYPPAQAVAGQGVLDVHKIHFILAALGDVQRLLEEVLQLMDGLRSTFDLPDEPALRRRFMHAGRFDPAEVVFIKRVLQHALPQPAREAIAAELFRRHVTADEAGFARELYLSVAQLQEMAAEGMDIGGHGRSHEWLGHLDAAAQAQEIESTQGLLAEVSGMRPNNWIMSYPYGSYDSTTLGLLRECGCTLGLTTRVGVADDLSRPLELPRLDANDLPGS